MNVIRADHRQLKDYLTLRIALYEEVCKVSEVEPDTSELMRFRIASDCANVLLDPKCIVLLAYDGLEAVALFKSELAEMEGALQGGGLWIRGLYVHPDFRGNPAIFRQFYDAFLEILDKSGITRTQVKIVARNKRVLKLAARFGFRPVAYVLEKDCGRRSTGGQGSQTLHREGRQHPEGWEVRAFGEPVLSADARVARELP